MIDWRIGAGTVVNRWVRNPDWINITTPAANEEKAVILKAVFDGTQEWTALSAAGNYTVDWGDGNIINYASGATAEHTYNYANANLTDTSATLGYKQTVITITPQVGQQLTSLNIHLKHSASANAVYESGFLDCRISGASITSLKIASSLTSAYTPLIVHKLCEYVYFRTPNLFDGGFLLAGMLDKGKVEYPSWRPENISGLFYSSGLRSHPPIDLTNVQEYSGMYNAATYMRHLQEIKTPASNLDNLYRYTDQANNLPSPDFSNCTSAIQWASWTFKELPETINLTNKVTDLSYFYYQTRVKDGRLHEIDTSNVTNIAAFCYAMHSKLTYIPLYIFVNVTNASSAFNSTQFEELPAFNLSANLNFGTMLANNPLLRKTGIIDASAGTIFSNIVQNCGNLEYMILQGCRYTVSIANCKFPKANIEAFLAALGSAAVGTQTITISGNPGTGGITALSGTTTAGSKAVDFASTAGVNIGDRMTGTGSPLTTAIAVSFQDTGDTVTLNNHQLSLNHPVSFPTVVTTTGIAVRTIYYVSAPAANTFQLAATPNGAALPLTTNGTGTMIYDAVVESIEPNVSVTLTAPATSTSTSSKSFRALNTSPAVLRGFTISG